MIGSTVSFFGGLMLGWRLKAVALIPVSAFTFAITCLFGVTQGDEAISVALSVLVDVTTLQFAYLCPLAAGYIIGSRNGNFC